MSDKHTLRFGNPPQSSSPHLNIALPENVTRYFVPTPNGMLELLFAQPPPLVSNPQSRKKALLFQHGGFGSASVFLPFLTYFSSHGYPCYALSLRGHGASYSPSFLSLVYLTTKYTMTTDLSSGIAFIRTHESQFRNHPLADSDLVLIGHSAGGGLAQYYLSEGMGKVAGLVLLASFPNFGGWGVYLNWARLDPFFLFRYIFQLFHPRSPLSSMSLVHKAFFSEGKDVGEVGEFEKLMPEVESLAWPVGMLFRFVDLRKVVRGIVGWSVGDGEEREKGMGKRVLVVAGGEYKLMGVELMRKMAAEYRGEVGKMLRHENKGGKVGKWGGGGGEEEMGVGFVIIEGSGHHVQNDVQREVCAGEILAFLEQL